MSEFAAAYVDEYDNWWIETEDAWYKVLVNGTLEVYQEDPKIKLDYQFAGWIETPISWYNLRKFIVIGSIRKALIARKYG